MHARTYVLPVLLFALALPMSATASQQPQQQEQPQTRGTVDASLTVLSHDLTIWYYYLSSCPYCRQQEPILHRLEQRYGVNIEPISLDGGPPQHRLFGGYKVAGARAAHLSIRATPTLYLFHPDTQQAAPLSVGLIQALELKRRIVRIARRTGWLAQAVRARRAAAPDKPSEPKTPKTPDRQQTASRDSVTDRILREALQR